MSSEVRIGIVGGSGLYQMAGISNRKRSELHTPFGKPSDHYRVGTSKEREWRSWRGIIGITQSAFGIKFPGQYLWIQAARRRMLLSASAVGSLERGTCVLWMSFYRISFMTARNRAFRHSLVMALWRMSLWRPDMSCAFSMEYEYAGKDAGIPTKRGGTYVCMEGPQFSTKAESKRIEAGEWI